MERANSPRNSKKGTLFSVSFFLEGKVKIVVYLQKKHNQIEYLYGIVCVATGPAFFANWFVGPGMRDLTLAASASLQGSITAVQ